MQRKIINLPLVDIIPSSTDSISSTTKNRQVFSELQKFTPDNANNTTSVESSKKINETRFTYPTLSSNITTALDIKKHIPRKLTINGLNGYIINISLDDPPKTCSDSERDIQKTTLAEIHRQCLKSSSMSTINDQKTHQKNTTEVATSNKFDESVPDFDFEESNKKFDKKLWNKDYLYRSTLKRLCDNKKEEDCFHYDKNKSFFDRITCESTNPKG